MYQTTLNDNNILKIDDIIINNSIFENEKYEYQPIQKHELIDKLIDWISQTQSESDKYLMKEDLEMLYKSTEHGDACIFSSISTNDYILQSEYPSQYNQICKELLTLNNNI